MHHTLEAPALTNSFALEAVRFQTITRWPDLRREAATADPMAPSPKKPNRRLDGDTRSLEEEPAAELEELRREGEEERRLQWTIYQAKNGKFWRTLCTYSGGVTNYRKMSFPEFQPSTGRKAFVRIALKLKKGYFCHF